MGEMADRIHDLSDATGLSVNFVANHAISGGMAGSERKLKGVAS